MPSAECARDTSGSGKFRCARRTETSLCRRHVDSDVDTKWISWSADGRRLLFMRCLLFSTLCSETSQVYMLSNAKTVYNLIPKINGCGRISNRMRETYTADSRRFLSSQDHRVKLLGCLWSIDGVRVIWFEYRDTFTFARQQARSRVLKWPYFNSTLYKDTLQINSKFRLGQIMRRLVFRNRTIENT